MPKSVGLTVTIDARNVPEVLRLIELADELAAMARAYGIEKLHCERIMRDGDPLPAEWMRVVESHDAYVAKRNEQ